MPNLCVTRSIFLQRASFTSAVVRSRGCHHTVVQDHSSADQIKIIGNLAGVLRSRTRNEKGGKNWEFAVILHAIFITVQANAKVTAKREFYMRSIVCCHFYFSMMSSDHSTGFQGHGTFHRRISQNWCILETKLLLDANRLYRLVRLSMTLSDP